MLINYSLLGEAINFYQNLGYTYIDVPWMVDPEISNYTWGDSSGHFTTTALDGQDKHLVGSAEQGFIQMAIEGKVHYNRLYVSVTPCFRRGDTGPINQETFMKVELNAVSIGNPDIYKKMMMDAKNLFVHLGVLSSDLLIFKDGDQQYDIIYVDDTVEGNPDLEYREWMELGSYGYRKLNSVAKDLQIDNFLVHYGTGLALPRFQLINHL